MLLGSDGVTVQIAQDKGFFKQEGLNVKTVVLPSTNAATPGLLSHTLDFTTENYVGMFQQQNMVPGPEPADRGRQRPGHAQPLRPDGRQELAHHLAAELKGKKVSFPAKGFNYGSMATDIQLQPYHLSSANFTTVALPFSAAPQAVATGTIDAAFTTEPFITIMESSGARELVDLLSGPLAGFPVACWGTTASFVAKNPKTVAAFQRAMAKAVRLAAADTPLVRQELPKFVTDDETADGQRHHAARLQLHAHPGPHAAGRRRDDPARRPAGELRRQVDVLPAAHGRLSGGS